MRVGRLGADTARTTREVFEGRFGRPPDLLVRAPGRVNLLGAHVDYSEGWVLPAALDRAVYLAVAATDADVLDVYALELDRGARIDLASLPPPVPRRTPPRALWSDTPAGVAWVLRQRGWSLPGLQAVLASDVPIGAGLSSSAAVEVAFLLAWSTLNGDRTGRTELAGLCQQAENAYLGVQSGIMDPFTWLHGQPGQALLVDCRSLAFEGLPLPDDVAVLVADSGVRRRLTGSEFNRRRRECEQAVEVLSDALPGIRTLRDVAPDDLERHGHTLPEVLLRRARHVVAECDRVHAGAEALRRGDLAGFGAHVRASHASTRDHYEVSTPELDTLAEAAWATPGCFGARLTGAGFGGCVVVVCAVAAVGALEDSLSRAFQTRFARRPQVFRCRVDGGARVERELA